MATVFKPTYTKPIPLGAGIVVRNGAPHARFRDRRGRLRVERLTQDHSKLLVQNSKWYIRYRDADGSTKEVAGFTDKVATEQRAAELERQTELRKAGVITEADDELTVQLARPISEHHAEYELHLRSNGTSEAYRKEKVKHNEMFTRQMAISTLPQVSSTHVERFLSTLAVKGLGPRTRNLYLESLRGFLSWCRQTGRMSGDPLAVVGKANEAVDKRRQRRALTEEEQKRLVQAAQDRPLNAFLTAARKSGRSKKLVAVSDAMRSRLFGLARSVPLYTRSSSRRALGVASWPNCVGLL